MCVQNKRLSVILWSKLLCLHHEWNSRHLTPEVAKNISKQKRCMTYFRLKNNWYEYLVLLCKINLGKKTTKWKWLLFFSLWAFHIRSNWWYFLKFKWQQISTFSQISAMLWPEWSQFFFRSSVISQFFLRFSTIIGICQFHILSSPQHCWN